jgi:hypothetical protein
MGYGGWDDVVTQALMEVVLDDRSSPDILWTFKAKSPHLSEPLAGRLVPGIDRGRVTFYNNVDCNELLPLLAKYWIENPPANVDTVSKRSISLQPGDEVAKNPPTPINFSRGEQDHPPKTEFYVGRVE